MEDSNEKDGAVAILGVIFAIVVALECICGALEVFGVSTGNFGGMVCLFIPLTIISLVVLWVIGKLINKDLWGNSWVLLGTILFLWVSIICMTL